MVEESNNETTTEVKVEGQEPPKKKDESKGGTFFAIVFGLMLLGGFMFLGDFNNYLVDKLPPQIVSLFKLQKYTETDELFNVEKGVDASEIPDTSIGNKSRYKIVGVFETSRLTDGEKDKGYLYIRKDGTFAYDSSTKECYNPLVGTYTATENTIEFKTKVSYGCNSCFNMNVTNNFTATINDNDTIVIEEKEQGFLVSSEYKRNSNKTESAADLSKYITNPVKGKIPADNNESWTECN